ncbi:helix-turn-helix transcriptional regulator [Verminephrobacter aporrectodeae]|uniref:helix-turn-helix transcriptional regulator n=1 Tax=Verminephrobacter aporrectodeae TaxID=1110389 RepID=UPI0002375E95|nr:helix-turn-helix transcriptional regulator [Verminephrobacter aporrectodeae]
MEGRALLQLLLDHKELSGNGLATALRGAVSQSSIQKYLAGTAREPRRATLEAFANHFCVPIEAFYDEYVAEKTAHQLGLISTPPSGSVLTLQKVRHLIQQQPVQQTPSLRNAFRQIRVALTRETPGVRRSVVALIGDLADKAEDTEFSEHTIDRMMAVLGEHGGKPAAPESTHSRREGSR